MTVATRGQVPLFVFIVFFLLFCHEASALLPPSPQTSPTSNPVIPLAPVANESAECSLCTLVLDTLDTVAVLNTSVQTAIQSVLPICAQLPPTPQAKCTSLVEKYTPVFLRVLISLETPTAVCTALGLCNTTLTTRQLPILTTNDDEDMKDLTEVTEDCTLCRYVIASLSEELEDANTQKQFLTAVANAVCSEVPTTYTGECEKMILEQGQTVVFITLKNATPQIVCSAPWLPICPSANSTLSKP